MPSPVRTCIGCRARRPQSELLPLRRRPDGQVVPASHPQTGRSAYLCPSRVCFDLAVKRQAFSRAFGRRRRTAVEPTTLWSEITRTVSCELEILRRTAGPIGTPRLRALETRHGRLVRDVARQERGA